MHESSEDNSEFSLLQLNNRLKNITEHSISELHPWEPLPHAPSDDRSDQGCSDSDRSPQHPQHSTDVPGEVDWKPLPPPCPQCFIFRKSRKREDGAKQKKLRDEKSEQESYTEDATKDRKPLTTDNASGNVNNNCNKTKSIIGNLDLSYRSAVKGQSDLQGGKFDISLPDSDSFVVDHVSDDSLPDCEADIVDQDMLNKSDVKTDCHDETSTGNIETIAGSSKDTHKYSNAPPIHGKNMLNLNSMAKKALKNISPSKGITKRKRSDTSVTTNKKQKTVKGNIGELLQKKPLFKRKEAPPVDRSLESDEGKCPVCLMMFDKSLSQLDIDGHIAACLYETKSDMTW